MPRRTRAQPAVAALSDRERWALALLLLGPVAIVPDGLNRFVFAKAAVVCAGGAVAYTCRPRGGLARLVVWGLAIGAALLVAAALAGSAPLAQLIGRGPRYEGLAVLPVYVAAGASGARLLGPERAPEALRWAARLLAISAAAVGLLAVLEATGLRPLSTNVARPGSLLGNASDEGAFAVLALGPLTALGLALNDRWVQLGAVAAAVTIAVSESRGALVGAAVTAALLIWLLADRRERALVAGGLVVLAALAFALPATRSRTLGSSPLAGQTVSGRLMLWRESLSLIAQHPILGVGPSGFEDAIVRYHTLRWEEKIGPSNPPDSPHDLLLQAAVAGGLPFALLVVLLAGYAIFTGFASVLRERAARAPPLFAGITAGLVGYGVALSVHLTSPGTTSLAALFGGVLLARPPSTARARSTVRHWRLPRAVDVAVPSALAVLALALVLAAAAEIPMKAAIQAIGRGDLGSGQTDFNTAHDLRPWDIEVDLTAGHAYAVEALDGVAAAAGYGQPWLASARSRLPSSEQVLEDLAAVRDSTGAYDQAASLLDRALRLDPFNPQLLLRRGVVDAQLGSDGSAEQLFLEVARIAPASPQPWSDLATLYRAENRPADAERAAARAAQLSGG
jgi:O-antigen ligase/Flp pilus assembly protein TadD